MQKQKKKKTCLWLKNLPLLEKTNIVKPKERIKFKSGKSMPKWYADAWKLHPKERSILRSKTFPGIAKAIAEQWGKFAEPLNKEINHSQQTPVFHSHTEKEKDRRVSEKVVASRIGESRLSDADNFIKSEEKKE